MAGYKVVELGTMITGPVAGMMLGDLGADVIKVERHGGDPFRAFDGGLYSPHFVAFNRNKRSVELNLQSEDGRSKLLGLLEDCDILIDNYRPGVLDRLGLAPQFLRETFPRLVHCSITGFGDAGPDRERPAYDTIGQALSGLASLAVDPHTPELTGTTIADNVTGMYACYAVMAALLDRVSTGRGKRVEVNMLEASIAFMPDAFINHGLLGIVNDHHTRVSFSQCFIVRCGDDRPLALHLSSQEKFWTSVLGVLDAPEIGSDPRFGTRMERVRHYSDLSKTLQSAFARRPRAEWLPLLVASDVPHAPVNSVSDVMQDAQVQALGIFRSLPLACGPAFVPAPQSPVLVDGERLSAWSSPPLVGQHTQDFWPTETDSPHPETIASPSD